MFRLHWKASGLWGFATQPAGKREDQVATVMKAAQADVLSRYATGRMQPNLHDRLQPSAFALYQFSRRQDKYRKQQLRCLGAIYPYYSPRLRDFSRPAMAIIKGNARQLVRALHDVVVKQAHMRDLVTKPGTGYNIRSSGKRRVKTTLMLPGARILNRGGERLREYREELLDLTRGGGRDSRAIIKNIRSEIGERLASEIESFAQVNLKDQP